MTGLLKGKRGVVMGVANGYSIAWGIAKACAEQGAEMAFAYQGDAFKKRVEPLAAEIGVKTQIDCDVSDMASLDAAFAQIEKEFGQIDFLVHSIAFSNKEELKGRYVDTTLENFLNSMNISCYSFTAVMKRAAPLMKNGGSAITLSYYGAEKVMPFYNVMGVAKAALESSVRYLAMDLGQDNIRVNAISAGPMRTLAGSAIGGARKTFKYSAVSAPLQRNVDLEELGNTGVYLLSGMSSAVTGEIHYVDCGANVVGMCPSERWDELMGDGE